MRSHRSVVGALAAALLLAGALAAAAQIAPPRTLEELKAEIQARADRNVYPVIGLKPDDVREALRTLKSLDRDDWAAAWSAVADRYMERARTEEAAARTKEAQSDYRQAWRYFSFARWPVTNSPGKEKAYRDALAAFAAYARFLDPPPETVRIPYQGKEMVGYLLLPKSVRPAPLVMTISALDSRKEESIERGALFLQRGIAMLAFDMPGTGQTPFKIDVGVEAVYSAALDYARTRPEIDARRIVVQGGSWSGYWAAKLGFVERERLNGVVVQSGPVHYYFQPEWQKTALGTREYLFDLFAARASVYGVDSLDEFLAYGPRLSLKDEGYLDKPSAPMLLLGGVKDTQVPIADFDLLLHTGDPKEAWVNPAGAHMGRNAQWSDARIFEEIIAPWIERRLALAP